MTGRVIAGRYLLEQPIGRGAMGVVWRATYSTLGRDVAIKVLPDVFANDPERLARFDREARLLASLNHPNIASIYGVHEADGIRFLALELVDGEDLAQMPPAPQARSYAGEAGSRTGGGPGVTHLT